MNRDRVYLLHIQEALARVAEYTAGGRQEFLDKPLVQDAVIRQLEIVGEAVKNLSAELRDTNKELPWKQIAGMRDKLIHEYFGVDLKLVWNVVELHLPALGGKVDELLTSGK